MPLPPADSAWVQVFDTRDIDQHAALQTGWSLRYDQISSGKFSGRIHHAELPELVLFREDTSIALRQQGRLDSRVYGFAMALHDTSDVYFNGQRVPEHGIMCGKGDEIDLTTPPAFTLIAVVVGRDLLNRLWELMHHMPLAPWLENQTVLTAGAAKARQLRQLHLAVLERASAHSARRPDPEVLRQLRDEILLEWMEALPAEVDLSDLPSLARRKRLVDRACEVMLAHSDEPLSVLEICSRVGASRRKLNYCFQDVLGTTPVRYLRALRLNGVRRSLRQAASGLTVQDVASHWGFWHLSQFAKDYRALFGELPSVTLRKTGEPAART